MAALTYDYVKTRTGNASKKYTYARVMNQKQYELKDHLGNVRVTFSDRKEPLDCDNLADGWVAVATSVNNYYSFGMLQPGRNWNAENYRFGFNGKENDNEVKGTGNSVDFGARIYDPRLGRWLSVDPQFKSQPGWSPYKAFLDNPTIFSDPAGETEIITVIVNDERTGKTVKISMIKSSDVMTDGVPHMVSSGIDAGGYHNEKYYYDFETIYTVNIAPDGTVSATTSTDIKSNMEPKYKNWFNVGEKYDRKSTESYELKGGVMFTSSYMDGNSNTFVTRSAAVEMTDADGLMAAIGACVYNKGEQYKSLIELVEYMGDAFNAGQDIVDVIQQTVEAFSPAEKTPAANESNYQYKIRVGQFDAPAKIDTVPASDTNEVKEKGGEVLTPVEIK